MSDPTAIVGEDGILLVLGGRSGRMLHRTDCVSIVGASVAPWEWATGRTYEEAWKNSGKFVPCLKCRPLGDRPDADEPA